MKEGKVFNLTNDERKAALFLAFVFLIGLGVIFLSKQLAPGKPPAYFNENLGKINLNTADKKLLMSVSGIGEKLSQRIIDFRESNIGFENVEELKNVKGITEAKFDKIKGYLTVR
ncbi:MAG: helix-hairpin-helix domain-containing protein [Candidatus Omnitrophica bacterium]|nr:helix-hairpin-helix domain-containing protein [Candidatus Omnitrophota bacterium]